MSKTEHSHHILPVSHLGANLAKLMVLMVLTVVAARLAPIPDTMLANFVAMGIAVAKAVFVISIFMAVKFSTNLTKLFALGGFVWLLLIFGIMIDYFSRPWELVTGWEPDTPSTSTPRDPNVKE